MNKLITLLGILLLMNTANLFAQYTFDWEQNAAMDQKQSVMSAVDSLDNVIVTGYLQAHRIFTRKYDITGTLLWEVQDSSGIHSIYEKPNWINCDANNNVLVVGNQYSISSSYDYPSAIVAIKYNSAGTLLWRTVIPISILINSQTSFDCRSVVDANGNLYIGTAISVGVTLYKLDTNGNLLFTNSSTANAGKNFNGMRIRNNKIAVVTNSGTPNVAPVFVWDTTGSLLWSANAVGALAADVEIDESENVYVLGSLYYQVTPITWDFDAKLTKFDSNGNLLWARLYDFGGYNFTTRMTYVNNRISAIGYGNSNGLTWQTFQTDTSGTLLWSSPYTVPANPTASDEYPHYVLAKASGEVIVTGVGGPTPDPFNPSYNQMPIVQYSNTGVQNWVSTPNMYAGTGLALLFASDGSLYAIGSRNMYVFHYNDMSSSVSNDFLNEKIVKIFPNPFSSEFTLSIETEKAENTSITFRDVSGRVLKTIPTTNLYPGKNEIAVDFKSLQNGIYFCAVESGSRLDIVKIIKF